MQVFELLMGDAEFHAAERVRLDEIDELPADGTLWELALQPADQAGRSNALQETPDGTRYADIHLGDPELDVRVGAHL